MLRRLSRAKVTAALPADSMWTRSRDELLHQTRWQRISRNFHRAIVEEPSWGRLLACALAVYTLLSVVLAAIVWALYTDDTARPSFAIVWYSSFLVLFVSHTLGPENAAQMCVVCVATFGGAMLALVLFGVIYEKFSMNGPTILFADKIMAVEQQRGQRRQWVLTFRMCAPRGQRLLAPSVRLHVVTRNAAGGVENHRLRLERGMDDAMAATPAAFYLRHYVDDDSPLFAAGGGGGESTCRGGLATEHVLRVFGTVVGMDQVSLIDVAGHASWDAGRDIVRGGVFKDMSLTMGSNRMDFTKLNAYTVNNTGPDADTDGAESAAK